MKINMVSPPKRINPLRAAIQESISLNEAPPLSCIAKAMPTQRVVKERSQDPRPKSLQKVQNIRGTMRQEMPYLLEFEEVAAGRDSEGSAAKEEVKEEVKEENKLQHMLEIDAVVARRGSGANAASSSAAAPMLVDMEEVKEEKKEDKVKVKEEVKEENKLQHMLKIEEVVARRYSEESTAASLFATAPMDAGKEDVKEENEEYAQQQTSSSVAAPLVKVKIKKRKVEHQKVDDFYLKRYYELNLR